MNPHTVTITGQQYLTNVQTNVQTGTTTVTAVSTANTQVAQTATVTPAQGGAYQLNCGAGFGCNWPYTYDACWGTGQGNNVACDGYLYQNGNGCIELAVPTDTLQQPPYDHYDLLNLPSSYPPIGSWVVVKGQLFQGSGSTSNGSSCPSSYITVSSIQSTNPPPSP
jgi:hypothetical protein